MAAVASSDSVRLRASLRKVSEAEQELERLRRDLEQRVEKEETEDHRAIEAGDLLESSIDELRDMISEPQGVEREGTEIKLPE
jgi:uncharacterized protein YlxW (UPF0749 family)